MYTCIIRETFVFTVFRRVFHSILKLELCRHACRRRDQIIPTCRYGKNMPTTALHRTLLSNLTPGGPLMTPAWSLTPAMHYTLVRGSSHQIWWPYGIAEQIDPYLIPTDHYMTFDHSNALRSSQGFFLVLWSTQCLSTFISTQRISQHVDIIFNISTKEQWKNKMSIITWEAAMSYATTFHQKNEISLGPKRHIITNWEP